MKPAWMELSGLAVARNKKFYENLTAEQFEEFLSTHCSISEQIFLDFIKELEHRLKEKFD